MATTSGPMLLLSRPQHPDEVEMEDPPLTPLTRRDDGCISSVGRFLSLSRKEASMAGRFATIYDALGQRVTSCCMAYSTYMEFDGPGLEVLCCKACHHPVPIGQGDGTEFRPGVDPDAYYEEHFRRERWNDAISHASRKESA